MIADFRDRYDCSKVADHMGVCAAKGDAKGEKRHDDRLGFLTPILKGFLTEAGKEAADMGIQIYGGHGYIKDNKAEQVFRAAPFTNMARRPC
jgi:alkylation response protein AidB-like acyl-CoA dehydrogenase